MLLQSQIDEYEALSKHLHYKPNIYVSLYIDLNITAMRPIWIQVKICFKESKILTKYEKPALISGVFHITAMRRSWSIPDLPHNKKWNKSNTLRFISYKNRHEAAIGNVTDKFQQVLSMFYLRVPFQNPIVQQDLQWHR